jgi:hypothetical protein
MLLILTDVVSSWKKKSISNKFLQELHARCPKLRDMSVTHTNLAAVTIDAMPKNVESLAILYSLVPAKWFSPLLSNKLIMPNLLKLDLSFCGKTTDFTIECIARAQIGLTTLRLNGCYLVTCDGLKIVADNLKLLTVLEVSETKCDDLAVHHICRGLPKLQALNLSRCMRVTDGSIATIASTLRHLKSLKLRGCSQLTERSLSSISTCSDSLSELDIAGTSIHAQEFGGLNQAIIPCAIIWE